ncbi:hypothetical protein MTX35_24065 [Rhodococcus sp. ARC_M12]|uniref:hypothetical protein n=1 Tax=Rhodococcus sp. ARC_M12 TaxID=2928854 RepID=UPI001FB2FFA7|nr:hypothetical protein [Rhodococcus sp. ARC_M12]MCJ0980789.1 hypothetical protein [Rhodococcus sp. ARC_M12]
MRALVFLAVLALVYKWPLFGDSPGEWSALSQGVMLGAIVSTAVTPAGWKAIRRIRGRLDGSYSPPESSRR